MKENEIAAHIIYSVISLFAIVIPTKTPEFFEATRKTLGEFEGYCNRENYTFNFN
jgi:hypothetical protein